MSGHLWLIFNESGIKLAGLKDIAAMKINAITNRGTRKDFIDIAFLLNIFPLEELLKCFQRKYPDSFLMLALRSLMYFDDAEQEPLPRMLVPFEWDEGKNKIVESVNRVMRS